MSPRRSVYGDFRCYKYSVALFIGRDERGKAIVWPAGPAIYYDLRSAINAAERQPISTLLTAARKLKAERLKRA